GCLQDRDARAQVDPGLADQIAPVAELEAGIGAVVAGDDEADPSLDERVEPGVLEMRSVGEVPAVAPSPPEPAGELGEETGEGGVSLQPLQEGWRHLLPQHDGR